MDFSLSDDQRAIADAVKRICARFPDEYWSHKDTAAEFPHEFHAAMAADGWLGITMPEELGGSNLGVTEAAIMMNTVAAGGGGAAAMSTLQINLFAPHPIVVLGTPEQKQRMLRPLISGAEKTCFGVTRAERRSQHDTDQDVRKAGRWRLSGQWQQDLDVDCTGCGQHPAAHAHDAVRGMQKPTDGMTIFFTKLDRKPDRGASDPEDGARGRGFERDLHRGLLHPEPGSHRRRGQGLLLPAAQPEPGTDHRRAPVRSASRRTRCARAAAYARDRVVFGRPIGQNQSIQHPLAENWCQIEAAWLTTMKAASLYDAKQPCGSTRTRPSSGWTRGVRRRHPGRADARRHGLRQGVPGRASVSRIDPAAAGANYRAAHSLVIAEKELGMPKSY